MAHCKSWIMGGTLFSEKYSAMNTPVVLFLSRYFIPDISGGARRASSLLPALSNMGINTWLGAPEGADYPNLIGAKHPVFGKPQNEASQKPVFDLGRFIRRHFLLPDPEIRWALRLVKKVKESGIKPDYIIASGPPESLYLAGYLLKKYFGCKLVFDMRDPWFTPSQRPFNHNFAPRKLLEKLIAHKVFAVADGIIAVSQKVLDDGLKHAKADIKTKIIGHFADDFTGDIVKLPQNSFNIVHTGSIGLSNPLSEFAPALSGFEALVSARKDAVLYLIGKLEASEIAAINNSLARENIKIMGQKSYAESRSWQKAADALLLVSGKNSHALPGKYSEYSFCNRPIILSGKGEWCGLLPTQAKFYEFDDIIDMPKGKAANYPHENVQKAAALLLEFLFEI